MATNCQAIAATTDEQCENDSVDGDDFCGIASHNASARTVEGYDGEDTAQEWQEGDVSVPFSTDQEWWDNHADDMLSLMNREARDGESAASSAARAVIKKETEGTGDHFRAMFGTCDTDECDRGCNGFDTDYCGKPDHNGDDASDDASESPDGDGTVTVEKDGVKVTGTPEEIQQVLDSL